MLAWVQVLHRRAVLWLLKEHLSLKSQLLGCDSRLTHASATAAPSRLLLLNWRDPWHPGAAELLMLRVLENLRRRVGPVGSPQHTLELQRTPTSMAFTS